MISQVQKSQDAKQRSVFSFYSAVAECIVAHRQERVSGETQLMQRGNDLPQQVAHCGSQA